MSEPPVHALWNKLPLWNSLPHRFWARYRTPLPSRPTSRLGPTERSTPGADHRPNGPT